MRAECRMLRCGVELSTDGEIKNLETIGDCRKLLRNLKVEKLSLISEYGRLVPLKYLHNYLFLFFVRNLQISNDQDLVDSVSTTKAKL